MADSHPPQPSSGPAAKTRSPVERLVVWGLIGALLVAVAIEYMSRTSYQKALTTLQDGIEKVDKDPSHPEVTEADVKKVVGDKTPSKTEEFSGTKASANGAKRLEVYSWFTLNPTTKRELWVWYGAKGKNANELATVIEVQSSEIIAEIPRVAIPSEASNEGNPMVGGPGGMRGMGGPPGGGMMGGPPGGRGGPGGARGRPGAGKAAGGADKADADKADADTADAKTTDDDKTDADKAPEDKTGEDETAEDKTEDKTENDDAKDE